MCRYSSWEIVPINFFIGLLIEKKFPKVNVMWSEMGNLQLQTEEASSGPKSETKYGGH